LRLIAISDDVKQQQHTSSYRQSNYNPHDSSPALIYTGNLADISFFLILYLRSNLGVTAEDAIQRKVVERAVKV